MKWQVRLAAARRVNNEGELEERRGRPNSRRGRARQSERTAAAAWSGDNEYNSRSLQQQQQQQQHRAVTITRDSDYSPQHEVKQHGSVWLDIIQACVVCKEGDVHSRR